LTKIPVFDIGDTLVPSHSKINEIIQQHVENAPEMDINKYNIYVPEQVDKWLQENNLNGNAEDITQSYLEWKSNYLKRKILPEVKEINEEYGPVGFISDNSKEAKKFYKQNFEEAGIGYRGFKVSAEVGVEKPDAKIFKAFLQEREEPAENFVYFGNYVDRDKAAEKTGMDFVWVKEFHTFGSSTEGLQIEKLDYENVSKALQKVND
jgi:FMN phosphatase YigB (HAD superfamily)